MAAPAPTPLSSIIYIHTGPVNAALLSTAGFDFALAYGFDLFTGSADVSFNGNYTYDYSRVLPTPWSAPLLAFVPALHRTACNVNVDFQGAGAGGGYYSGGRKFGGTLNFNYREGAWSLGTQVRINGDSVMNNGYSGLVASATADRQHILIPFQSITFTKINGQNVAIPNTGQSYAGWAQTNYNPYAIDIDLRASYRWSNNITLFSAIDNIMDNPQFGNNGQRRSYRLGVRWNY